jgi:hypothetical protein
MTVVGKKYVVTGGDDGFVKIFDFQVDKGLFIFSHLIWLIIFEKFRLILWFERLKAGPITSISFCNSSQKELDPSEGKINQLYMKIIFIQNFLEIAIISGIDIPEFTISTKYARVILLGNSDARHMRGGISTDDKGRGAVTHQNKDSQLAQGGKVFQSIMTHVFIF